MLLLHLIKLPLTDKDTHTTPSLKIVHYLAFPLAIYNSGSVGLLRGIKRVQRELQLSLKHKVQLTYI